MAWMWLSGLVDSLEDRIIACENVLTINPTNDKVRAYLTDLQQQHMASLVKKDREDAVALLNQAKAEAERNYRNTALQLATQAVEKQDDLEEAWLLIGKVSPNLDQRIAALRKAYKLNPSNAETISALKQAQHVKSNPLSVAAHLEQQGKFEEALELYKELAGKAKDSQEFDQIYKHILHIEGLQKENIRYVSPAVSIARLTFGWPLLYLSLALLQMGLNPFKYPVFHSCLGLPMVILGGFLLSLAEVRSRHVIWQKLFAEQGDGSSFARSVAAVLGWLLILAPHVLLIVDSLNRLRNFQIPPAPF
jgi:tetratricopeptide (TPR) repeat protein